jgi:hypothetical protein
MMTMKSVFSINNHGAWRLVLVFLACVIGFTTSCKDDDDSSSSAMTINKVYLENAQSSVPDREVTFARLGQVLRLEGSGFLGVEKVLINGESCYFNPVFVSDNSMLVQVSGDVPILEADPSLRNTIQLIKGGQVYTYSFDIRAAAPSITGVSHTMPPAGAEITIYGTGLQNTTEVIFPGNVQGTNISSDDEDGEWVKVTVPGGITGSGSITVICDNGGAYSPAYFNFKEGVFQNFDDVNNYSWASGITDAGTPLTAVIPSSGAVKSSGGYQVFNASGSLSANGDERYWTNSSSWPSAMLNVIPAGTAASDCGIQMDIYVEGEWNSGIIRFVMADGWGSTRYCMLYEPIYVDNAVVPFENPGCWFTITLPFASSSDFEGKTFGDVVAQMAAASYKQAGPWFENSGIKDVFDPVPATQKIYFDNLRVVLLTTPTYSDFPDE